MVPERRRKLDRLLGASDRDLVLLGPDEHPRGPERCLPHSDRRACMQEVAVRVAVNEGCAALVQPLGDSSSALRVGGERLRLVEAPVLSTLP